MSLESKRVVKKQVLVLATSTLVTETREEEVGIAEAIETTEAGKDGKESESEYQNLAQVPYIRYPINSRKQSVSTLLDLGSKVNVVHSAFTKELGLPIRPTDVEAQKIDSTMLETYGMVVAAFSVKVKTNRVRFFEETFLVANVSPEVVLGMLFLILNGANVDFLGLELRWRTYSTKEALPTTRRVKLVGKKEFVAAALNPKHETYVVYAGSVSSDTLPSSSPLNIHPFRKPQIFGLIAKKAPTKVPVEYSDFADVFSLDLASKLPEHTRINDHAIELVDGQQPLYGSIYSLKPVKLKTLKAYIETNLVNEFIRSSKLPAGAPISFNRKSDGSFWLCVDYQGLNNLTIKNRYPLLLIGELLDRLRRARRFTQLDFTNAYH